MVPPGRQERPERLEIVDQRVRRDPREIAGQLARQDRLVRQVGKEHQAQQVLLEEQV